jgi:hypothetical protein
VERPGRAAEVYNVAISDDRQAVEALKLALQDTKGNVIKVKSQLPAKTFNALQMKPGDVLAGAQPRKRSPAKQR